MTSIVDEPGVEIIAIRTMSERDLDAVVRIDAAATGRARPRYFELMLQRALKMGGLHISLVAESDGRVAGFVIGSLFYGEYGMTEPTASIDAIGVEPASRRHRIAHALLLQLHRNVAALGVTTIRTEVEWSDFELLAFFRSEQFAPAPRLCLERSIDPTE
ncbi:MAG TPA: GNAT family N-acetyltransferase [Thermoanaerobaculia bacterium]|nr:GNAT family N-acetyltransferase [Thermoanaerobaculia bacterium]